MNLTLAPALRQRLEALRSVGATHLRPLGLEADLRHQPLPPDHPFFALAWKEGMGSVALGDAGDEEVPDHVGGCLLGEEASYWDRGMAVALPGGGLGGVLVRILGTPEQKQRLLSPFADQDGPPRWAAFALTEPGAGSDSARIITRATRDGDGWVLNGAKMFSSNSRRADWVAVVATVDPARGRDGHRVFIVERGTPGFEILRDERKMGVRAYETCSFALDDCRVPASGLLGGEPAEEGGAAGFKAAMTMFAATRPLLAAHAVGIARAAFDLARAAVLDDYPAQGRRRDLALERLADIRRSVDSCRLLYLQAAWRLDQGDRRPLASSVAKMVAAPEALRCVDLALAILGEAGLCQDRVVEKLARDVKMLDIGEGTGQIQRLIIARALVGLPA